MVRQGLRSILSGSSDLEIVGESANGVEALCAVEQHRPAVVLMDRPGAGTPLVSE
jgi:YesN/AraC family two-component response regulator